VLKHIYVLGFVQEVTRRPEGEVLLGSLLIECGAGLTLDAQSKREIETLSHALDYRKEGFDIGCVARPHLATDRSTLDIQGHADDHPGHSDQLLQHPARYSAQANPHRHLPRPSCPRTRPLAHQATDLNPYRRPGGARTE
jgi:hypothetical protein